MNTNNCSGYGLLDLLKDKKNILGLEIGCSVGDTTTFLLENIETLHLDGIDPYTTYEDWNGYTVNRDTQPYDTFIERMKPFKDRFSLFRKTSDEAVGDFEDETFDFIFIDGLHTYEQVKKDIQNFYPKLKRGGLFSGHDYHAIAGVRNAVDEFANSINVNNISFVDFDVWYWYKA